MKVALIFPNNISKAPYLSYYIELLEKQNIEYTIYNWDRIGQQEPNCKSFQSKEKSRKKLTLLLNFLKFKKFVISNINNDEYDRVIVFSCQIAILLKKFLSTEFKDNYLIDVRDYSKINEIFKNRFKNVILSANLVCISSNGFRSWLPKSRDYIMSHNIHPELLSQTIPKRKYFKNDKINVDTIGALRDHESNIKVIKQLKNNQKFHMKFIGDGYALPILKEFSNKNNVDNIYFHGLYQKEDESKLLEKTDFINIIVGNDYLSKWLTTNRLYLCALLKIPAIVYKNTEQSTIINKYGFGLSISSYDSLVQELISFSTNFDEQEFINNCKSFLKLVRNEQKMFELKIIKFIS